MPQRAMGGAQKIALRGIFAELPNHDAAQALLGRVADLDPGTLMRTWGTQRFA